MRYQHHSLTKVNANNEHPDPLTDIPPEMILNKIHTGEKDQILDLGAGTGYLTLPAAKMTTGTVHAMDFRSEILQGIQNKADAEKLTNIHCIHEDIHTIPLPDDSIDIVLSSLTLHGVNSLSKVLREVKRVLRSNGRFLCIEFENIVSTQEGPPMHMRIPSSVMEKELSSLGFSVMTKEILKNPLYVVTAVINP